MNAGGQVMLKFGKDGTIDENGIRTSRKYIKIDEIKYATIVYRKMLSCDR